MADPANQAENFRLELVSESRSEKPPEPPVRFVHRRLRGRYRLAALLAALLATVGGIVGYFAVSPKYVSTGLVHIEGAAPAILYPTQESKVPPLFNAYVASQVAFLRSWKLLAAAVQRPEMTEAGWPVGPKGVSALSEALTVSRTRGENTISVSVTDRSPLLSQTAVNTILAVYRETNPEPAGLSLAAKERALVRRENDLEAQLHTLRLRVLEHSDKYGHIPIKQIHAGKATELMAIEHKLTQIRLARRNREAGAPPGQFGLGLAPNYPGIDLNFSPLQDQELALVAEIKSAQTRYAPNHRILRWLEWQLEVVRTQRQLRWRLQNTPTTERGATALDGVDRLEGSYTEMRDRLLKEAAALGLEKIILIALEEQVAEIKQRLSMTRRRLDEIRFEAGRENADQITIVNGGLPGLPSSDRRAGLAGAGMMLGAASGIAFVVLIGLRDRRIRYLDELEAMNLPVPIIGLMPDLANSAPDPAIAQFRHLLQLQRSAQECNVYVLTSCDHSEGKTNVALALAISFAEEGHKTLLIDAAFSSPRLSRKLDLTKRPGLREALGAGNGNGAIYTTRHENLVGMPIGAILGVLRKDFTKQVVRRLYDDLRYRYDTIIVDTGPVGCDFDACLVAAEADQVVMIVERNQERDQVRTAVSRLRQLGIDTVGLLFNGASEADILSVDRSDFDTLTADGISEDVHVPSRAASDWQQAA